MRSLATLVFALLWSLAATAQTPLAPALWVIRDADTTITLFGSIHTLPVGIRWQKPAIMRAFDAADTLVLEAVIPDNPLAMLPTIMRLARKDAVVPLGNRVPENRRAELNAAVERLRPGPLDAYDSWYAALEIASTDSERRGVSARNGVEAVLTARARARGMPVTGLESFEQQLGFFDSLPETDQVKLLLAALDDLPDADRRSRALVDDWLNGRIDSLATALNDEFDGSPSLRMILLNDRNARWASWIAARMAQPGKVFIAVGAGHMAGPDSLLDKLRSLRIEPERVNEPTRERRPAKRKRRR
ncbi:TraB/GumN family protein [Sandaracinobacteroides saxicola]|uniref:TraB/GumN family protein n=1 Tax=Sandaracinobacteroides saxicola TaxID=2759707 RepID=A0A7G5ILI8_9SPHN|nr:TraB/GumN family protein [Sandaracinobacteroides saxicola]QMW24230.1 TraB/GumN family protein [Sandaracinobacteroides saxicola]